MRWEELLSKFDQQPLFHSRMLELFNEPSSHIQVQLSRWVKQRKLSQIRRGWYLIQKPFRKMMIPAARIANDVVHPSYLSLEWALGYYGLIPEHVPNLTCVTTQRGIRFTFENRFYSYRNVKSSFFKGYTSIILDGQSVLVARPEKSLLDKIYFFLQGNRWSGAWLRELRLQNMEDFDSDLFKSYINGSGMKNLELAVSQTITYIREELE